MDLTALQTIPFSTGMDLPARTVYWPMAIGAGVAGLWPAAGEPMLARDSGKPGQRDSTAGADKVKTGLFDMALKNLKSPNLGFLGFLENKNLMSDLSF